LLLVKLQQLNIRPKAVIAPLLKHLRILTIGRYSYMTRQNALFFHLAFFSVSRKNLGIKKAEIYLGLLVDGVT
jgi:hypothetical protein